MRSSLFHKILLILFLLIGLSPWIMGQPKGTISGQGPYTTAIFDSSFEKALYKGSLDIAKYHLSGLFLLKKTSGNSASSIGLLLILYCKREKILSFSYITRHAGSN